MATQPTISVGVSGSISDVSAVAPARRWEDSFNQGVQLPNGRVTYTAGTGVGKVNSLAVIPFSVVASGTFSIDLLLGTGFDNVLGDPMSFSKVKFFYVELDSPLATNSFFCGPDGVSNGWLGWFSSGSSGQKIAVRAKLLMDDTSGFAVSSGNKILYFQNVGGSTVAGKIILAGES